MTIFVIMPVHNNVSLTLEVLDLLARQSVGPIETVVVDDGSTDGTADRVAECFPAVTVLPGDGDLWWTGAMALGVAWVLARSAEGDLLLTMNNDVSFADDYVANLVDDCTANGRAIVGSFCRRAGDGRIVDSGARMDWAKAELTRTARVLEEALQAAGMETDEHSTMTDEQVDRLGVLRGFDWLCGRGTLVPVEVFQTVGNFDSQRFPHYSGDTEFFYRARQAGYELIVSLRAFLTNIEDEKTTGIHHRDSERLSFGEAWGVLTSRRSSYQLRKGFRFIKHCCPRRYRARNKRRVLRTALALSFGRTWLGLGLRRMLGRGPCRHRA